MRDNKTKFRQFWAEVKCARGRKATVMVATEWGQSVLDAVKAKLPDAKEIVRVRAVRFGTLVG